jgi:hypothetical protein
MVPPETIWSFAQLEHVLSLDRGGRGQLACAASLGNLSPDYLGPVS